MFVIVFNPFRWSEYLNQRLIDSTPLLPGFDHLIFETKELKRVHSKFRMCKLKGHLWEIDSMMPGTSDEHPDIYNIQCASCFPHMHSRRTYETYNLFAISEKEPD